MAYYVFPLFFLWIKWFIFKEVLSSLPPLIPQIQDVPHGCLLGNRGASDSSMAVVALFFCFTNSGQFREQTTRQASGEVHVSLTLMTVDMFQENQVLTRSRFMEYSAVSRYRKGTDRPDPVTFLVRHELAMFSVFSEKVSSHACFSLFDGRSMRIGTGINRPSPIAPDRSSGGRRAGRPAPDRQPVHAVDVFLDQFVFISDNSYHIPATVRPPMGAPLTVPCCLKHGTA